MLLLEEIRLHLGYKDSQRVLISYASHMPQTDELSLVLWSTASQNLRPLGTAQLGPCGSTSLASCQHVGRFCVRVCLLFVCNWRARFKQNIIVLCICRHDMVAIMMSNPGLSNKFDVDPLSNSDSKMSNSHFSRGRLITLPRSACLDLRGECFKCRSKIPAHPLRLWMEVTHFGGHGLVFILPNPECKQLDWKWKIWSIFTSICSQILFSKFNASRIFCPQK